MSINFNDLTGGRLVDLIEISDNFIDDLTLSGSITHD